MRIHIAGLGHIGEQVLRHLSSRGLTVAGVDVNPDTVRRLLDEGFHVTTDYGRLPPADAWLLVTSTGPGASHLIEAFRSVLRTGVAPGSVISVESTLPPGTMARLAEIARSHGLEPGRDVFLAHVPHRMLLGEEESPFAQPRVVSGWTPPCLERALELYASLGADRLWPVQDVRLAELAKLVENAQRYVDIAFAEAVAVYCAEQGLPFEALRQAVNTKPNVRLLDVDFGIGGECLPKDAAWLAEAVVSPLLKAAMATDQAYRDRMFRELRRASRVVVRGITYKPGYPDMGHSRAVELVRRLEAAGVEVGVEDELLSSDDVAAAGLRPARDVPSPDASVIRGRIAWLASGTEGDDRRG